VDPVSAAFDPVDVFHRSISKTSSVIIVGPLGTESRAQAARQVHGGKAKTL
jgi:hypothetical protein